MTNKKLFLIVLLYTLMLVFGRNAFSQNTYKIPIVSIDSIFRAEGFKDAGAYGRRFTNAVSNILDSLAMDSVMVYVPNFKNSKYIASNFSIHGYLGMVRQGAGKGLGYEGYVQDNLSKDKSSNFGCMGRGPTDINCFCFNTHYSDSVDYKFLKGSLFSGLRLIMSLVPMHKELNPTDSKKSKGSFAFNSSIKAGHPADQEAATIITKIINNTLVFNQASYKTSIRRNYKHYNYYPNYRASSSPRESDFTIAGTLNVTGDKYKIQFDFGGKDVNLVAPERLITEITFDKKRFLRGDYTEAMYEITGILYSFILMNTMF